MRFDHRSKNTFKKDIYFATMLEKYFFNEWLKRCEPWIKVTSYSDNGCGNDGEFIEKGNTAGADYRIWGSLCHGSIGCGLSSFSSIEDEPLEIKWVPTAGKFTLKENDLRAYVKENASILFIYNSINCGTNLRKPKDYNLEEHIKLIESKSDQIRWGIMWSNKVKEFYNVANDNGLFRSINYMGGKSGIVLKQNDFHKWFTEHKWRV